MSSVTSLEPRTIKAYVGNPERDDERSMLRIGGMYLRPAIIPADTAWARYMRRPAAIKKFIVEYS